MFNLMNRARSSIVRNRALSPSGGVNRNLPQVICAGASVTRGRGVRRLRVDTIRARIFAQLRPERSILVREHRYRSGVAIIGQGIRNANDGGS